MGGGREGWRERAGGRTGEVTVEEGGGGGGRGGGGEGRRGGEKFALFNANVRGFLHQRPIQNRKK